MIKILRENYITGVFLFCSSIFLYQVYRSIDTDIEKEKYLKDNYSFTIAKTTKFWKGFIEYKYYVDGKKYEGSIKSHYKVSIITKDNQESILRKFFKIKYSNIKPEINHIYLNVRIIDSQKISRAGFKIYKPGYH